MVRNRWAPMVDGQKGAIIAGPLKWMVRTRWVLQCIIPNRLACINVPDEMLQNANFKEKEKKRRK